MKIAVIGAGLSGCVAYHELSKRGCEVSIFEKSRGVGGRISTRYIDGYKIDHGTPFFEAKSDAFVSFCEMLASEGILRRDGGVYVPTDGINQMCAHLVQKDDLICNTKITSVRRDCAQKLTLTDESGRAFDGFDLAIITIPAPQVLELDIGLDDELREKLQSVTYHKIATIIATEHQSGQECRFDGIEPMLKKLVDNSAKYGYDRDGFRSFVFHFSPEASRHIESKDAIIQTLSEELKKSAKGCDISSFTLYQHLWKYALVDNRLDIKSFYDASGGIGFCGDYMMGDGLESAYLSAMDLVDQIGL